MHPAYQRRSRSRSARDASDQTRVEIHRRVKQYLEGVGAVREENGWQGMEQSQDVFAYLINTVVGPMRVVPHCGWVTCVFSDVPRAQSILRDVKPDGHWLFNPYPGDTAEKFVEGVIASLDHIVPMVITTRDGHHYTMGHALFDGLPRVMQSLNRDDVLTQAISGGNELEIQYTGGSTPGEWRSIIPQGFKAGPEGTLLEAIDLRTDTRRAYRVDRIAGMKLGKLVKS